MPRRVNASIGTFVPKAFTPFQWDRFEYLKVTTERLKLFEIGRAVPRCQTQVA